MGKKDRKHAPAAFPDRTPGAVFAAILRCASNDVTLPAVPIDREAVRARIRALPLAVIADRLPLLMQRNSMYGRPHAQIGESE